METHLSITSEWLLIPRLSFPGNGLGASIPKMAVALTSVLLNRMSTTHIWHGRNQSSHHERMAQPLHMTMEGTNPLTMSEWLWISALISDMEGTKSSHHDIMAQPLYLTYSSEWLWDSSFSLGGNLYLENTKLLPEVLEIHPSQWLCQYISYLLLRCNILELHYSPLHQSLI